MRLGLNCASRVAVSRTLRHSALVHCSAGLRPEPDRPAHVQTLAPNPARSQSAQLNVCHGWRIQPVNAMVRLNLSAGVWKPSFSGLWFNCLAMALSLAWE